MKKILIILVIVITMIMGCSFGTTGVKWQNQEQIAIPKTEVVYYEVRFYERGSYIWNKVTSEPLKSKPDEFMLKFTESFINKLGDDFKKVRWSLRKVDEAMDKKMLPIYIEIHIASDAGTFFRAPMGATRWNIYYVGIKQKEIYEWETVKPFNLITGIREEAPAENIAIRLAEKMIKLLRDD